MLKILNLASNRICDVYPLELKTCTNLVFLDLSNNNLKSYKVCVIHLMYCIGFISAGSHSLVAFDKQKVLAGNIGQKIRVLTTTGALRIVVMILSMKISDVELSGHCSYKMFLQREQDHCDILHHKIYLLRI